MPDAPWKQYLEAGMHFTELRRSQARRLVAGLVEQGQLARDQAAGAVDELMALSRRRTDELAQFVRAEIQRQLRTLGVATQDDLRRLERRLSGAGPARTAAKKTAAKKTVAKKAAAKRTAAKRPAAKKAAAAPSS